MEQGRFLVVDDEPLVVLAISRVLGRYGSITKASRKGEALELLRAHPCLSGMVIDLRLPDGCGLDVLRHARERGSLARAVLLSAALDPQAINDAFALDARCLCKPWPTQALRQFAREAVISENEVPGRITKVVSELAAQHALSPTQTDIVLSAVQGVGSHSFVASRRVSEPTYRSHVRAILRKTRTPTLAELRDRVLQSVTAHPSIIQHG